MHYSASLLNNIKRPEKSAKNSKNRNVPWNNRISYRRTHRLITMNILITGGTGFLGACLTKKLLLEGHKVIIYSRRESKPIKKIGQEQITADINDKNKLNQALKNIDTVYHLAAAHLTVAAGDDEFWRVNVEGVRSLVESAERAGVERLVIGIVDFGGSISGIDRSEGQVVGQILLEY